MDGSLQAGLTTFFGGRARLVACPAIADQRGSLRPVHFADLPFTPCRAFAITGVPVGVLRGGHAHRRGLQLLLCLQGRVEVLMRVAGAEERCELAASGVALLIGPEVWRELRYLLEGAVLLGFADTPYDPLSYIVDETELT